jgi:Holliday junction resolvase
LFNFIKIKENRIVIPEVSRGRRRCFLMGHLLEYLLAYLFRREGFDEVFTDFYWPSKKVKFDIVAVKRPGTVLVCECKSQTRTIREDDIRQFFERVHSFYRESSNLFVRDREPLIWALFVTTSSFDDSAKNYVKRAREEEEKFKLELIDGMELKSKLEKSKLPSYLV